MLKLMNLLVPAKGAELYGLWFGLSLTLVILMAVAAVVAIVLILMQPSNSSGIDALGGSSETFFGKNKGKTMDAQLAKFTKLLGVVFFILALVASLLVLFGA